MRCVASPDCSLRWLRLAVLATVAVAAAGCSADFDRFDQSLPRFGRGASHEATGSAPQRQASQAGSQVQAAPLPPPGGLEPPATQAARGSDVTGSTAPRSPRPAAGNTVHVIAPGETLMKLSRQYGRSLSEIARANNIPPHTMVKVGDRIVIPGTHATRLAAQAPSRPQPQVSTQVPAQTHAQPPKPVAAQPQPTQPKPEPVTRLAAAPQAAPVNAVRMVTPAAHNPEPEKLKPEVTSAMPTFRWPVRGRVITAFGPRPTGQQNDGINVAVPEGTPVKAAEDGVVAYAGNELKTYGNLVLVRHSNGYVTAYAHASEIMVKRDDPVKRGQVIAKAGQTGSVSAPQLHFEIRKGSTPVDPMPFLDKGGSS
jgi:murein DD-endopeptidase MepM/ murein hydrolase activator NlpD